MNYALKSRSQGYTGYSVRLIQIKSKDYEESLKVFTKNGVKSQDTIPKKELRAMQNLFSDEGNSNKWRRTLPSHKTQLFIVSSDDYIPDGHSSDGWLQ